ncbi:Dipeptidyl aminopeptidase/acylaminoacyl peptidase [Dyella sp. OK004]|uniref:S9 family peptidase n=1 Tax=Dyella sp. OK004 TaxID=1855292 RepID=UPI0008DFF4E4|nr:DPP IV N-terminal domain-containing protein [Dyella sp. OK004]SFS16981.1 Dipeptidyl aminopeptidase/acylaminoacyl peptidase [Dyella sp. OK004]
MNIRVHAGVLLAISLWLSPLARAADIGLSDRDWNLQADTALRAKLDAANEYFHYPERIRDTWLPPQWLRDGERFVTWAATGSHHGNWVIVNARTGKSTPIPMPDTLRSQLAEPADKADAPPRQPLFVLAPDQQSIVFRSGNQVVALGLADGHLAALSSNDAMALGLSRESVWSPDARVIAIPRGDGFALIDRDGKVRLAREAKRDEGWELPGKGWSPDGRKLAVWRIDNRNVHTIPIVDTGNALEKVTMVPYAKAGTPLPRRELYVADPTSGSMRLAMTFPVDTYSWMAAWRPDGSEMLVLQLSRDGKRLDLVAVSAEGKSRVVLREERPHSFVAGLDFALEGWTQQLLPLADGKRFVWMSERDGWRHAYLYDYTGKLLRQITRGDFPVHQVLAETPGHDSLLIQASAEPETPYERFPYRVSLSDSRLLRLASAPGVHRLFPSPSGRYFVDGHSSIAQPRVWEAIATDGSTAFRYAEADASALAAIHYQPPEPFTTLAADGTTRLYGVLYKPHDFDPKKHYAVIDCIYGGPFTTAVPWSSVGSVESLVAGALAQMGFVTVVLDARGTPGRGKAFQDANYGRIGQTEIPDHVAALKQVAIHRPYMDLNRAGIVGHSWGGYFALRGMLTAPDFFKAGYAGAPGAFEEEAIINEPYLGLPNQQPASYRDGSNILIAANLRGTLRLMHGTADVNAPFSTTLRMIDALIKAGKRFELLVMPGETHSSMGKARRYYDDDVRLFFLRTLGGPE